MSIKKLLSTVVVIIGVPCVLIAQDQAQEKTKIQHVPIKSSSAASGTDMYKSYCAVCHGTEGKGDGPAASALKHPPANLTLLSKNNGGKYPGMKVTSTIRGTSHLPAHGSEEMPVWGELFRSLSGGQEGEVQQRIANLSHYIESLQVK
jgi:mono/diheme cytochrome c family protein